MGRFRHVALLGVSVVLVCVTGAIAIALTTQATDKAEAIHLQDRQALQTTLSGLGSQYLLFSLKEGLDYASTGTWNLVPGDPADSARLQNFVAHAVLLNYGAAVVDLGGHVLSSYAAGPGLPPISDPGYQPMIRALLAHRPDVSSVMATGGFHVVAMGVPITVEGVTKAVFVGYVRLVTSALETYVRSLHEGRAAAVYVIDSTGTVVAATDPARIGRPFGSQQGQTDIARGRSAAYLDSRSQTVVAVSALGIGGWGGATTQSATEFYGPLRSGHLRIELGIVALLVLAVVLVLVLNHKREAARRRFQAQLAYQATHDSLTGLWNRSVFDERLTQALSRAKRQGTDVAVLYLDLDGFKPVNDRFGHDAGDRVLAEVGARLAAVTRAEDTVARMGGDEFALVVEDVTSPRAVEFLVQRIIGALSAPMTSAVTERTVGVSCGIAYSPRGACTADALIRDADLAMYRAKDTAGSSCEWAPMLEPSLGLD